jgi:hypothetical protein
LSTDGLLARVLDPLRRSWGFRRPPHAFVLTNDRLVHVALAREAQAGRKATGARISSRDLPPGTFSVGAGGIPVAGPLFGQAISSLLQPKERITAASLAVPDGFVKVATVDVEADAAKRPRELSEVLRWKVSRLYGEPSPALRITWCDAGTSPDGGKRLLVLGAPEETVSSLEAAFSAHGIRIGVIEPAALALSAIASAAVGGTGLVVFTDGPNVSTVFLEKGDVRFLRTRDTAGDPEQALEEIRLAASFVGGVTADGPGPEVAGNVVVVPESAPVSARFREYRNENGGGEPSSLLPVLVTRGFPTRVEDPALLVGLGLLAGTE